MKFLDEFLSVFNEPGVDCVSSREDGIPYLTLYVTTDEADSVLSFDMAVRLAAKVQFALQCPVHFHRLEGDAISFFVFDDSRQWSEDKLSEYGTPLAHWLPKVLGYHREVFASIGSHVDDVQPTQASGNGFIWARRSGFYSSSQSGKWCVVCSEQTVDELWAKVREQVVAGHFDAAIVSTPAQAQSHGGTYVICVFNLMWTDLVEVRRIREQLRSYGVQQEIGYKRDIDTVNNIYGCLDEWVFRA